MRIISKRLSIYVNKSPDAIFNAKFADCRDSSLLRLRRANCLCSGLNDGDNRVCNCTRCRMLARRCSAARGIICRSNPRASGELDKIRMAFSSCIQWRCSPHPRLPETENRKRLLFTISLCSFAYITLSSLWVRDIIANSSDVQCMSFKHSRGAGSYL